LVLAGEDVEGELQERAEELFTHPQCLFDTFVIRRFHLAFHQRHQTDFRGPSRAPMKRRRALPGRKCRFAARLRVDSHVHVRHRTEAHPWRGQICLVRSLPGRRGMSQRDLERTLGRLSTDVSFQRDSFPEPGPRLSRARTSVCAHEAGSAAVAHFSPPVMAASAITRNDQLSAATVAVR
jgi:hypothetical protein